MKHARHESSVDPADCVERMQRNAGAAADISGIGSGRVRIGGAIRHVDDRAAACGNSDVGARCVERENAAIAGGAGDGDRATGDGVSALAKQRHEDRFLLPRYDDLDGAIRVGPGRRRGIHRDCHIADVVHVSVVRGDGARLERGICGIAVARPRFGGAQGGEVADGLHRRVLAVGIAAFDRQGGEADDGRGSQRDQDHRRARLVASEAAQPLRAF